MINKTILSVAISCILWGSAPLGFAEVTTSPTATPATTAEPVTTAAEPVMTTAEPVTTTAEPVTTTAEPITTDKPATTPTTTTKPPVTTDKPVTTPTTTTKPPVTTDKPATTPTTTTKPPVTTDKPATTPTTTTKPPVTTDKPATTPTTTTKPPVTTDKPATTPTPTPPEKPKPKLEDFDLTEADVPQLDMIKIRKLPVKAFGAFTKQNVKDIPVAAFAGVKASQLTELTTDAVAGLKPEQIEKMPPAAMKGLKAQQIGTLPPVVLQKLPANHFKNLDPAELKLLTGKDLGKVLMNLNATEIKPEDLLDHLSEGWTVNDKGRLIPPPGTVLALPVKAPVKFDSTVKVSVPTGLPDLNKTFALGGQTDTTTTTTVLSGLNDSLKTAGYKDFSIGQEDGGALTVAGSGASEGTSFVFIPESEGVTQTTTDAPTGLTQDETGHFVLTTPDKQQVTVIPAPKNPKQVAETLGAAGALRMDKHGVAILELRKDDTTPKQVRTVVFDPMVSKATAGKEAGLYVTGNTGEVVYADGTVQKIMPTIPLPDKFMDKAEKIDGVENVLLNADGTLSVMYKGTKLKLRPATFDTQVTPIAAGAKVATNIVVEGSTVKYTAQDGTDQLDVTLNITE